MCNLINVVINAHHTSPDIVEILLSFLPMDQNPRSGMPGSRPFHLRQALSLCLAFGDDPVKSINMPILEGDML